MQAVRGTVEPSRKIFDGVDVTAYSFLRVVKMLEFLQHQFTKMGHRVPPCDPNLSQPTSNHCSVRLTRSVRRRTASFKSPNRIGDPSTFAPDSTCPQSPLIRTHRDLSKTPGPPYAHTCVLRWLNAFSPI